MLLIKNCGLFLDDERNPFQVDWVELPRIPWAVVRSYNEFVEFITKFGLPKHVSIDCDLNDEHYPWHPLTAPYFERGEIPYNLYKEKTGRDCALWLVEYCAKNKKALPTFTIHSMNVVAREHVRDILENYGKV